MGDIVFAVIAIIVALFIDVFGDDGGGGGGAAAAAAAAVAAVGDALFCVVGVIAVAVVFCLLFCFVFLLLGLFWRSALCLVLSTRIFFSIKQKLLGCAMATSN